VGDLGARSPHAATKSIAQTTSRANPGVRS
jgi:hypothetical protein